MIITVERKWDEVLLYTIYYWVRFKCNALYKKTYIFLKLNCSLFALINTFNSQSVVYSRVVCNSTMRTIKILFLIKDFIIYLIGYLVVVIDINKLNEKYEITAIKWFNCYVGSVHIIIFYLFYFTFCQRV